jgi:PhzF family phenazine biosynthesis protein
VRLDCWLDDSVLQSIAAEHNKSTTAFLLHRGADCEIRYFLPIGEVPLVGHASLAVAHVMLNLLQPQASSAVLRRRNGRLEVARLGEDLLAIRLPAAARLCAAPAGLAAALGIPFLEVLATDGQYFRPLGR